MRRVRDRGDGADGEAADPGGPARDEDGPEWIRTGRRGPSRFCGQETEEWPRQERQHCEPEGQGTGIAERPRQPQHGRLRDAGEVERVPSEEAQAEAGGRADEREGRGRRAFAQAIEMGADAGARDRHAGPEREPGEDEHEPDRADMGLRRQPGARGIRQEGAEDRAVAGDADCESREDAERTARIAAIDEVAPDAEEAETRALQDEAEQAAEHQRKGKGAALRLLGDRPSRHHEARPDRQRQGRPQEAFRQGPGGPGGALAPEVEGAGLFDRRSAHGRGSQVLTCRPRRCRRGSRSARRPCCRTRSRSRHSSWRHSRGRARARTRCGWSARRCGRW